MADIRIKDLATTASTTASDDFMAVDGTTNGTRKLSAATPSFATSVTVPGVAGPTATDLTLAGGSTGASLVLGQGTTAANIILTPKGTGKVGIGTATPNKTLEIFKDNATSTLGSGEVVRILGDDGNTVGRVTELGFGTGPTGATFSPILIGAVNISASGYGTKDLYFATRVGIGDNAPTERARITSTGNLLIGGTTDITGSGGLKVFGTTAASSTTTGALQVAGGVGVAGAGYFGGVLNVAGDASFSSGTFSLTGGAGSYGLTISNTSTTTRLTTSFGGSSLGFRVNAAGSDQLTVSGSAVNVPLTTSASSSTVGALTIGNGSPATNVAIGGGAINAGASVETVGYFRAASGTAISAATGRGVEIGYLTSADAGYITSYDRTGVAWKPLNLQASSFGLLSSGTSSFTVSSSGIANFTNSTASTGVGTGALQVAGGIYAGAASVFGGLVTATGNASTTAALRFDNQTGGGGTAQYYANYTSGATTTIGRVLRGNALAGYIPNGLNIDNFGGFQIGLNVLGGSGESFNIRNAGTTDLLTITSAGAATFAGTVIAPAATASLAPLRIPHGTAPTSPTNGDMWTTTAGLYVRINGVTVGPLS